MFAKVKSYFIGVWEEAKKVIWPTRKDVINNTTIVLVSVLIAMIIFGVIDYIFTFGLEALLKMGK